MRKLPSTAVLSGFIAASLTLGNGVHRQAQAQDLTAGRIPFRTLPTALMRLDAIRALEDDGRAATLIDVSRAHGVQTRRFQIFQDGLEVVGAQALAHFNSSGMALTHPNRRIEVASVPAFTPQTAAHLALETAGSASSRDLRSAPALKILPDGKGSGHLIYWVTLSPSPQHEGRDILLDAKTGSLIADIGHRLEMTEPQPVINHVRTATSDCQIVHPDTGFPVTIALRVCPTAVLNDVATAEASESARRASSNARAVIEYFSATHHRSSFDGKGSELVSLVHVGNRFANAFWDSDAKFMAYGDGDGEVLGDLTQSLDVAGHEMTHGVTSSTSQLIYMDESGALNEAFSDYFGVVIAARARQGEPDWGIGKEVFKSDRREQGLRNLRYPETLSARFLNQDGAYEKRPYPSKVSEKFESYGPCDQRNDRCYVHINSMIPARAMVLITDGIGMSKAEKLMYLVLTQYMTPISQFSDFKTQTLAACSATLNEADCLKVGEALTEVGF